MERNYLKRLEISQNPDRSRKREEVGSQKPAQVIPTRRLVLSKDYSILEI